MPDYEAIGRILIAIGGSIALMGALFVLLKRIPFLGRLPGDIHIKGENFSCFVPLATSLVLSLLLTIAANILLRCLRH